MQAHSATTKEIMLNIIASQPEDASYEEIIKELAFEHMIERGVEDVRKNRLITHKEMKERISKWSK